MLQTRDPHYAEAAFYAAMSYWRLNERCARSAR